ncbi:MAG: tRNA pseudouridine(55) synthase TruB [Deltaproteobacteria bacterium]|nr:tRNA pseudouridine(55) synthase TruB [Deltaproteobacteria bacterium]
MDGVLLIDKPVGPTSFDVVRDVRRWARERKAGHAGTLDPLASGLLAVCLGEATKLVPFLQDGSKRYLARLALGSATDTDDLEGRVIREASVPPLDRSVVEAALVRFVGIVRQVPPAYSALKLKGVRLYDRARRGEPVTPEAREVEIHRIALVALGPDWLELDVRCGKGTYIRSLARDVARSLGTCGHLESLRRLASSGFDVGEAAPPERIEAASREGRLDALVIPLARALRYAPIVEVGDVDAARVLNGQTLPLGAGQGPGEGALVRIVDSQGRLLAVSRIEAGYEGNVMRPQRGFRP